MPLSRPDPQDRMPLGRCEDCGRELYEHRRSGLCPRCQQREERQAMSLQALSEEYRQSAALLGTRMDELHQRLKSAEGAERDRLHHRLAELYRMYRQTMTTARELAQYYE